MEENLELKKLYEEDITGNRSIDWNDKTRVAKLNSADLQRREKVSKMLEHGELTIASDYHHAALIFQHGDITSDYEMANNLAKKAMEMGDERSKWLYAATLDRFLLSSGKAQKYGTQFITNAEGKIEVAKPLDKNVTDAERAKFNVPPLNHAVSIYKQKYGLA